jgi:WD40 repeat protein
MKTMVGYTDPVNCAEFSFDGRLVMFASRNTSPFGGSKDNTMRVLDATRECQQTMSGHTSPVTSATFSPDGRQIVSASHDKTVRVWDVA